MTITPDQARELLAAYTPGDYSLTMGARFPTGVAKLSLAAPDMAATIAGMRWEYGLEAPRRGAGDDWVAITGWFSTPERAIADVEVIGDLPTRRVRRLVGPVEEVTEP